MDKALYQDEADKLLAKGQVEKALDALEQTLRKNSQDLRSLSRAAEIYLKKGQVEKGSDYLNRSAEIFVKEGQFSKAIAVLKRMLKISLPQAKLEVIAVHRRLADLYVQLGLSTDAVSHYRIVYEFMKQEEDREGVIQILKRMEEIGGADVDERLALAKTFKDLQKDDQAKQVLARLSEQLKESSSQKSDLLKVQEAWVTMFGDDGSRLRSIVVSYIKSGNIKEALTLLQKEFQKNSSNPDILELLSETFKGVHQLEKAKQVDTELVKLYQKLGRMDKSAEVSKRLKDPDILAEESVEKPMSAMIKDEKLDPAESLIRDSTATPEELKILAECDVYLKYGLIDKARDVLELQMQSFPHSLNLRWKLKNILQEQGETLDVIRMLEQIIRLSKDQSLYSWESIAVEELKLLKPGHILTAPPEGTVTRRVESKIELFESAAPIEPVVKSVPVKEKLDDLVLVEEDDELEELEEISEMDPAPTPTFGGETRVMDVLLSESDFTEDELASLSSQLKPEAPQKKSEVSLEILDEEPMELMPLFESPKDVIEPQAEEEVMELTSSVPFSEVDQDKDELLELINAGMLEDAKEFLVVLQKKYPDYQNWPVIAEVETRGITSDSRKFETLGSAVNFKVQSDERFDDTNDFFDLGSELKNELEDKRKPELTSEVREVLNTFKKGISATLSPQDSETHFDLGIAYREMGLWDEAYESFKLVSQNVDKKSLGLHHMALCEMARERWENAKSLLVEASQRKNLDRQSEMSIRYDLSEVYIELGQAEESKKQLEIVSKLDPEFRDVHAKLTR